MRARDVVPRFELERVGGRLLTVADIVASVEDEVVEALQSVEYVEDAALAEARAAEAWHPGRGAIKPFSEGSTVQ
jgi:hypothetical protein